MVIAAAILNKEFINYIANSTYEKYTYKHCIEWDVDRRGLKGLNPTP